MDGAPAGPPAVSALTRHLVRLFLVALLVCGLGTFEVFPFSGFRLFSELRGEERKSWQLRAVDADGDEHPIVLGELPLSYRKTTLLIDDWDELPAAERDEICRAWSGPLRAAGVAVDGVRIYQVVASVWPDGRPAERRLVDTCGEVVS